MMDIKEENEYALNASRDRSRSPIQDDDSRDGETGSGGRDRDRGGDRERGGRKIERTDRRRSDNNKSSGGAGRSSSRRTPADRRVYVSNIPYEYKWQDLKDLFRKEVGEVSFVEMFNDENNRPRGCAIIEFDSSDLAVKAVDVLHRYELKGRKLVVKEDIDVSRDRQGRIVKGGGGRGGGSDYGNHRGSGGSGAGRDMSSRNSRGSSAGGGGRHGGDYRGSGRSSGGGGGMGSPPPSGGGGPPKFNNTYGLSTVFLESLGISGTLVSRVFVANLDYKVDEKALQEVFKIAGKVVHVEISKDQDGKSRGFGVVEYDHPVQAVQAISMLHNQIYLDRKISVRMDRVSEKQESAGSRLPPGLQGLGMGLGANGMPITDLNALPVAAPAPTMTMSGMNPMTAASMGMMGMGMGMGNLDGMSGGGGGMGLGMGGGMGLGMGGGMGSLGGMNNGMGSTMGSSAALMGGGLGGGLTSLGGSGSSFMGTSLTRAGISGSSSGGGFGGGSGGYGASSAVTSLGGGRLDYGGGSSSGGRGGDNLSRDRSGHTVQVANLPMDYTWQSLRDLCREFGDIRYADIRPKGTGTVRFANESDARRAVEMLDRQRVDGRVLDVCFV